MNVSSTTAAEPHDELFALLSAWCNDTLPEADQQRLCQQLRGSAAARAFYIDYMNLHGALVWRQSSAAGRGFAEQLAPASDLSAPDAESPFERVSIVESAWSVARDLSRSSMALSMLVSALVITIVVLSLALVTVSHTPSPAAPSVAPPPLLARVSATVAAEWDAETAALLAENGQDLRQGDRLLLHAGIAEVTFDTGARLLLEAPAELRVADANMGELLQGRVVAHVPKSATGYVLYTPGVQVVDLGTEFGVQVTGDGATDVHVFEGVVDILPRAASTQQPPTRLEANQRASFTRGGESSGGGGADFAGTLIRRLNRETIARQLLHPHIISYWNCDLPGEVLYDLSGYRTGRLEGDAAIGAGLIGGGGLHFSGRRGGCVRLPENILLPEQGLTIELLVSTEWDGRSLYTILRKEDGAARVLLGLQPAKLMTAPAVAEPAAAGGLAFGLNVDGEYLELDVPLDGADGRPTLEALSDGQPHHLVATYDVESGLQQIYLDGQRLGQLQRPAGKRVVTGDIAPLFLGASGGSDEFFAGVLDEIAIYSAALSEENIQTHWHNIKTQSAYFDKGE